MTRDQAKSREKLIAELTEMHRQIRTMRKTETDHLLEEGLFRTLEHSSQAGIYVVQGGNSGLSIPMPPFTGATAKMSSSAWNP